ncbi:MAG: type IV toxin-antitoxin system AbiEi family antitoxin domain-containing protein [Solirubrobacterales bacterium]
MGAPDNKPTGQFTGDARESASSVDIRRRRRTRGVDREVGDLAGRQHGVLARSQLLVLGLSRSAVDRRIRAGRLRPLHRGVYAVGHTAIGREGWWMAAVLAAGPGAVLSHRSAAALWGIRRNGPEGAEVTVARPTRSSRRIRRHVADLPDDERTERRGIPVTTAARTVWDLAAASPPEAVEADLRQLEYLRLYDRTPLAALGERYPGRRGARRVRRALSKVRKAPAGRVRSPLEQRFLSFLDRYRLPRPQLNAWIDLPGRMVQVDCLWPAQRQVVELDGWRGHSTGTAFREDRARDRRLRVAGYEVARLTWSQLDDEPAAIAGDLRALLYKRT